MKDGNREQRRLSSLLRGPTFAVLICNGGDPSRDGPFEAWAYCGPLDFEVAAPMAFGVGDDPAGALESLDGQLAAGELRKNAGCSLQPASRDGGRVSDCAFEALRRIHDLLYLDAGEDGESYNPEKEWKVDLLEMIAEIVAEHIPRPGDPAPDRLRRGLGRVRHARHPKTRVR